MHDGRSPSEVLAEVQRLLASMHKEAPPAVPSERTIRSLVATVAKLSQPKMAHPPKVSPDYVRWWNDVGVEGASRLSNRAVRYLSWETDVAIQPSFQSVALSPERISSRSLQGLVRSVHRRWNTTAGSPSVGKLRLALANYSGKNPLLTKWKEGVPNILSDQGPTLFARGILSSLTTWEATASVWGLEPETEFANTVLEQCIATAIKPSPNSESLQQHVIRSILTSRHWNISSFKKGIEQLILASVRFSQSHTDALKAFILADVRLFDPRLPANAPNWIGIEERARDIVIQWLSAEDIQLFFDHVLPTRSDPHGRKPFWMKYKSRVRRSRPLLSYLDETRWQANASTSGKRNFGKMQVNCDTSAFLLDFGKIIVVEFSKVGNAVYVYNHKSVPELVNGFWSNARFTIHSLKQPESCIDRLTHSQHWMQKMRTLLAQHGVLPGD